MPKLPSFSQLDASDTVLLYKRRSNGTWRRLVRRRAYLFNFTRMCERFGTGTYLIRVVRRTGIYRLRCRITGGRVLTRQPWKAHYD